MSKSAISNVPQESRNSHNTLRLICGVLGLLLFPLVVESSLVTPDVAAAWVSLPTWVSTVQTVFGAEVVTSADETGKLLTIAHFDLARLTVISWGALLFPVVIGMGLLKLLQPNASGLKYSQAWGTGLTLMALWWVLKLIVSLTDWDFGNDTLLATLPFWWAIALAVPLAHLLQLTLLRASESRSRVYKPWQVMTAACVVFTIVFVMMNFGLWFNLRIPHGDSSMYEEHLWNVLHGKGFRSYLDQGLFLGEHIQVIHLGLLPLYALWPSHLLLELTESIAIAWSGFLVYRLARQLGCSRSDSVALGIATLLCFPMQYLDIAIDLKTFRPIVFGIPFCLLGLIAWEQNKPVWTALWFGIMLLAKEDYAVIVGCFGASVVLKWLWDHRLNSNGQSTADSFQWKWGLGFFFGGIVYLKLALEAIVWFRSGVEVHYASYFQAFGDSTSEIIWTMLTQPWLVVAEVVTPSSIAYACCLLVPLGGLGLRSPFRLLSCVPMFLLLCLNELSRAPQHHFHAPLMPLLLWASAAGLAKCSPAVKVNDPQQQTQSRQSLATDHWWPAFVIAVAFTTLQPYSMTPLGFAFWDSGSQWYGPALYIPDERAKAFAGIPELIPQDARVASTDFVHPRFTHYERSYDYSQYARVVSGGSTDVPEDTDFIVIDTAHPYSNVKRLADVRELQQAPEQWDVVPNGSNGNFIVLKRKS